MAPVVNISTKIIFRHVQIRFVEWSYPKLVGWRIFTLVYTFQELGFPFTHRLLLICQFRNRTVGHHTDGGIGYQEGPTMGQINFPVFLNSEMTQQAECYKQQKIYWNFSCPKVTVAYQQFNSQIITLPTGTLSTWSQRVTSSSECLNVHWIFSLCLKYPSRTILSAFPGASQMLNNYFFLISYNLFISKRKLFRPPREQRFYKFMLLLVDFLLARNLSGWHSLTVKQK